MPPELTEEQKEAARKKVSDEAARKKAKGNGADEDEGDSDDDETDPGDSLGFTKEQKAYVDGLRKESAKYRTKAKELESGLRGTNDRLNKFESGLKRLFGDDDGEDTGNLTPEQRIERLEKRNQQDKQQLAEEREQLALEAALKGAALEHGIRKENYEYFEFLVGKRLASLQDDEELTEDDLALLAKQANGKSAPKSTSVDEDGPDPDEEDGELTLEEFMDMGISARSQLYQKDKALYERLVAAEKSAKKKK